MLSCEKMLESIQAIFKNALGNQLVNNQIVSILHVSDIVRHDRDFLNKIGLYRGIPNSSFSVNVASRVGKITHKTKIKFILWHDENFDLCWESEYQHKKDDITYIELIPAYLEKSKISEFPFLAESIKDHLALLDLAKNR